MFNSESDHLKAVLKLRKGEPSIQVSKDIGTQKQDIINLKRRMRDKTAITKLPLHIFTDKQLRKIIDKIEK